MDTQKCGAYLRPGAYQSKYGSLKSQFHTSNKNKLCLDVELRLANVVIHIVFIIKTKLPGFY